MQLQPVDNNSGHIVCIVGLSFLYLYGGTLPFFSFFTFFPPVGGGVIVFVIAV